MPDIRTLSSDIREEACRLGFFKTGIAAARALPRGERFESWLQRGFQGTMRYLERQAFQRKNPALLFPDARSLLIVAMNYFTGYPLAQEPMKGKISRYAWGDDYHAVVGNRLETLLRFIQSRVPSAQGRWYVDAGPVMEKAWGAQTALGWMGKHTNLITRDRGSWFFIGAILLDIELEYDSPEKDFCGSCRRCLRACPTGAIVAPYVLDARLCISYLTIEYRGVIPRALRSRIGNRIYGCDDCQEVCPWNRFAETTPEKEWFPREENLMPELAPLVHITPGEFARRFSFGLHATASSGTLWWLLEIPAARTPSRRWKRPFGTEARWCGLMPPGRWGSARQSARAGFCNRFGLRKPTLWCLTKLPLPWGRAVGRIHDPKQAPGFAEQRNCVPV